MAELRHEFCGGEDGERRHAQSPASASPGSFKALAPDGYPLSGVQWRQPSHKKDTAGVVIINPATSVLCRYYFRFATFLFQQGLNVLTFDYRGIGVSRPPSLRRLEASWVDWGCQDFEAILRYAQREFPGQPIDVVGHSIGGFLIGLAESSPIIRRIFTVGAQFAYWRDYARHARLRMFFKWHIVMPFITAFCGYFPGKRLGWLEDTPKGIVRDWSGSRARFEDGVRASLLKRNLNAHSTIARFSDVEATILAVSLSDDPYGTTPAVERALSYFRRCKKRHLRVAPASIGESEVGHFGFFHSRFERTLWPLALAWVKEGQLPQPHPGEFILPWWD